MGLGRRRRRPGTRGDVAREVNFAVRNDRRLQLLEDIDVRFAGEQTARQFLGEPLRLVVRVANGHVEDGPLQTREFPVWVRLDHQREPFLEAARREARDIGSLAQVQRVLNEVVLCLDVSVDA